MRLFYLLSFFFIIIIISACSHLAGAEQMVNSTRVSLVMEPFEEVPTDWTWDANWTLETDNTTALFGQYSLKVTFKSEEADDENEETVTQDDGDNSTRFNQTLSNRSTAGALMWLLPQGPYNCYSADSLSLWYQVQHQGNETIPMRLVLIDDTACENTTNCAENELTFNVVLEENLTATTDWQELLVFWNDTSLPIHRIRGWKIEIELVHNATLFLDQLACHGDGTLFGAPFYVTDSFSEAIQEASWLESYYESPFSQNETNAVLQDGALFVNYTVQQKEAWGGFLDFAHLSPGNSYFNLSQANHLQLSYSIPQAASIPGRAIFRFVLQDSSHCLPDCPYDYHNQERYYSFHSILDQERDGTITIPLIASSSPETPFWLTGWSGTVGNGVLDVDQLKGYTLEIVLDSGLSLDEYVQGAIAFHNMTAVIATGPETDDSMCVIEPDLFIREDDPTWTRIEFLGSECCSLCNEDPDCIYAFSTGRDCFLASHVNEWAVGLANTAFRQQTNVFWMDDAKKRGDFCEKCDCDPEEQRIDCRNKNLTVVPKVFNETGWVPRSLDLRENPMLIILGSGALGSISETLEELWLPANMRHVGLAALTELPGLKSIQFERKGGDGETILNNAITSPSDSFADVCCGIGEHIDLTSPSSGLAFCDMHLDSPGADVTYFDFIQYKFPDTIDVLFPSSPFMAEAAESVEKCAEYCSISSECRYFQFDARLPNSEKSCHLLSYGGETEKVCCTKDHYADENKTIPGWISGMPPRTRHSENNAKVLFDSTSLVASEETKYTASFGLSLGSTPLRGAVWVVPEVITDRGYSFDITPRRAVLYDNETTVSILFEVHNVTGDSQGGTIIIRNNIFSCDTAFTAFESGLDYTVYVDIVTPEMGREKQLSTGAIIGVVLFIVTLLLVATYLLHERSLNKGDSIWKVDRADLHFADPPVVIGRGSFGLVLLAEYRGTNVVVKRVIPPQDKTKKRKIQNKFSSFTSSDPNYLTDQFRLDPDESQKESTSPDNSGSSSSPNNSNMKASVISNRAFRTSVWSSGRGSLTKQYKEMRQDFIEEMRFLASFRHPNIITVMGAVIDKDVEPMLIMEYMDHGSLYDILHNETMVMGPEILMPILCDVVSGIRFLHSSDPPCIHGDLKAQNILVDGKFRAKVADFGLSQKKNLGGTGTPFWMAPELLRGESSNTTSSDIYSFGILLYEAFSRKDPYDGEEDGKEVLRQVADPAICKRPPFPLSAPPQVQSIMTDCLVNDPNLRPSASELGTRLERIESKGSEENKSSVSLFDIFPRHIAEALRDGRPVEAEHRECVTIFFSDIVGFTTLSSTMEPRKVAAMLDRLYSKFDALSVQHDIFKVETIGDAYLAVTNLTKDQAKDHAKRIANFAIDAIIAANETYIDEDDPDAGCVSIRVGFHSGPVVADVVGQRNPRYCLFGDTVNTASRMESNSKENRIHCSQSAAEILQVQYPELPLKPRGKIPIKGKGEMNTFWVNEEANESFVVTDDDAMLDWVAGRSKRKSVLVGGSSKELRLPSKEFILELEESHPDSQPKKVDRVDIQFGDADDDDVASSAEFRMIEDRLKDRISRLSPKEKDTPSSLLFL